MDDAYRIVTNPLARKTAPDSRTAAFSMPRAAGVRLFHAGCPGYAPTPLVSLPALAASLGVAAILAKDESFRFGLNAFKVLGASYGVARELRRRFLPESADLSFAMFATPEARARLEGVTLVTATDGNHGRAVAWTAKQLGLRCMVRMPAGAAPARVEAIRALGAQVEVIHGNHNDAVAQAEREAAAHGWLLMQDTSRPGYETVPLDIMRGYMTLMEEAAEQWGDAAPPTHVFLQCGVGSMPAAVQAWLVEKYGASRPATVVVEPHSADCFHRSMRAGGETPVVIGGDMPTLMAGLACGEPSALAWEILRRHADHFVSCPDEATVRGMRAYARPLPGDPAVVSGESGAVSLGVVIHAMTGPAGRGLRDDLRLNAASRVLLLSTEGDTCPEIYRKIVDAAD
ncbi:MAG: diaminopropionate ammonia-lyase [Desulfovibrionaceae bacterium]